MTIQKKSGTLSDRQSEILSIVGQSGFATIEGLADRFGVSAQTVRRDIIALSNAGRLQRFHGGAGPIEQEEATRLDYHAKQQISRPEKQVIGKKAAALIPDGSVLYLDVGTTVEACAGYLAKRKGFTIFTNSMPSAMKFDPADHQIIVMGGEMAGRDGSLVGTEIVETLNSVSLDIALIACSAIDKGGRVMDFDLKKIAIKKAAINASQTSMLLATKSKVGRTALRVLDHIDRFGHVVSEDS